MKGAQVGATVLAENVLGYFIEYVRDASVLWASADADLAKGRLTQNIIPMLHASGMMHLIKSVDEGNSRKSGKTDEKLEWEGGGFCIPFGAKNADKMRQWAIRLLICDEVDGWAKAVKKDGDPHALFVFRTAAFEASRKIFNISTPTLAEQSKIEKRFKAGDQRKYHVRCLSCEHEQVLCWRTVNKEGVEYGIVWDYDTEGRPIRESVRFLCEVCQHAHFERDKVRLFDPKNGAHWKPTATPTTPNHRSYHLSGLYSMFATWASQVDMYLEGWDPKLERIKDGEKLQVFWNNVLGLPYELKGEKVRLSAVSMHRRAVYRYGEVPNKFAELHCLSPILVVTCAVDVHSSQLPTAVFGWTRGRRAYLLDYWRFGAEPDKMPGVTENLDDPRTWGQLRDLIESKEYVADDGKKYRPALTLIDSGYLADHVYSFASEYLSGVGPSKGREQPRGTRDRQFANFETPMGTRGYLLTVDWYKDRLSAVLRREWDGTGLQPGGLFNCPINATEAQLKELTVESKVPKPNAAAGYEWRRPSGAANELWDLYVYNSAALDIIAWDLCRNELELEEVDWSQFFDICETEQRFFQAA